jgi:hypothetical protein
MKETFRSIWRTVANDPNVLAGTVQVVTAIAGLIVAALSRKKTTHLKTV